MQNYILQKGQTLQNSQYNKNPFCLALMHLFLAKEDLLINNNLYLELDRLKSVRGNSELKVHILVFGADFAEA